jgi:cytochrome c nitrite reductase small subunit
MKKKSKLKKISIATFVIAVAFFGYIVYASKMPSYLSSDPKACINCHVMNTQYATWQHSSHAREAVCVDCHLPRDGFFSKYKAKTIDGWNHSKAFTMNTYDPAIKISEDGAKRVQANCISCHKSIVSTITSNADKYHNYDSPEVATGRRCWECHKTVPHGKVRATTTTPNNLGVKEVK